MARLYAYSPTPPNGTAVNIVLWQYPNVLIPAIWVSLNKQFELVSNGATIGLVNILYYELV